MNLTPRQMERIDSYLVRHQLTHSNRRDRLKQTSNQEFKLMICAFLALGLLLIVLTMAAIAMGWQPGQ